MRKIIIIAGDDILLVEKKLDEYITMYGEWNFARSLEEKKPMQDWLILKNESNLLKICEQVSCNIVIISELLFLVPTEIRIKAEIYTYNKTSETKIETNKNFQFWYLIFKKYIPKDISRKN